MKTETYFDRYGVARAIPSDGEYVVCPICSSAVHVRDMCPQSNPFYPYQQAEMTILACAWCAAYDEKAI